MKKFKKWLSEKLKKYDPKELKMGFEVEKEHGSKAGKLNVTNDDPIKTLKIALAHLEEDPKYYSKLKKVEKN